MPSVLLVEDEESFAVTVVRDGAEALEVFRRPRPRHRPVRGTPVAYTYVMSD